MAVRVGPEVTANSSTIPERHIGLNYKVASYTLNETASASTTLVMCNLPGGAIVRDALLTIDNDALDTTGGGNVIVQSWTGAGNNLTTYIRSASGSAEIYTYNPTHAAHNYRVTASSNMVVTLTDFVGTGTATTVFTLTVAYTCENDAG